MKDKSKVARDLSIIVKLTISSGIWHLASAKNDTTPGVTIHVVSQRRNNSPVRAHPLFQLERRKRVDDRDVPVGVTRVGRATTKTRTDIQNQNGLLSGLVNLTRRAGRSMRRGRFERLENTELNRCTRFRLGFRLGTNENKNPLWTILVMMMVYNLKLLGAMSFVINTTDSSS